MNVPALLRAHGWTGTHVPTAPRALLVETPAAWARVRVDPTDDAPPDLPGSIAWTSSVLLVVHTAQEGGMVRRPDVKRATLDGGVLEVELELVEPPDAPGGDIEVFPWSVHELPRGPVEAAREVRVELATRAGRSPVAVERLR